MSSRKLIIGLGTGRCGTVSLSSFLNDQPNTNVVHEGHVKGDKFDRVIHEGDIEKEKGGRHLFRWDGSPEAVFQYLESLRQHSSAKRFGDVAYYFLPYAEAILERWPMSKFVVLKRERSATVDSFLRKTQGRNHWMDHDGSQWENDPDFDPTFPTLDASSKKAALEQYWDLYYRRVDRLLDRYPDSFTLHSVSALNTSKGRKEILSFIGYEGAEMVVSGKYKKNANKRKKSSWFEKYIPRFVNSLLGGAS